MGRSKNRRRPPRSGTETRKSRPNSASRAGRSAGSNGNNSRPGTGFFILVGGFLAICVLGYLLLGKRALDNQAAPTPTPTPSRVSQAVKIDGIPCYQEMLTYHVHAHLSVFDHGKPITVPANTGINLDVGCLYWLHTHDDSGVIHVEAPFPIHPTLGQFFDIWGQPLSESQVATASPRQGEKVRIWVNRRPFTGNPRRITLGYHTLITIEVGPPYTPPRSFDFSQYD